jgi:ABC-type nitrate/sulfonate/bicarbonate transport system permease component
MPMGAGVIGGARLTQGMRQTMGRWWGPVVLVGLWLWWIWVGDVPRVVAPRPLEVLRQLAHPQWLLDALLSTVWLTVVGALLGLLAGTGLAIASWWFAPARPVILAPAVLAQVIPVVVFIPILGRLFGFGSPSVLAMAAITGFFPSLVFVDSGLSSVPQPRKELVQLLGASRVRYLLHVALPTSLPRLAVAVRLTASSAFLGAVTADYLVGSSGLGRLMAETQFLLHTSRSWAIAVVIIVMSIAGYSCAGWFERWIHDRFEISER